MPFITEEIWQLIQERKEGESIMVASMPIPEEYNADIISQFELSKEIIASVRKIRNEKNIPQREPLILYIRSNGGPHLRHFDPVITKLAGLSQIIDTSEKVENAISFLIKTTEYYVPLGSLINVEEEMKKLMEELHYQKGFLTSVLKKLENEKFMQNAPEAIIQQELNKKNDAESKVRTLEDRINALK
jgi:valyl-tRNA synthetase